jgi:lipid-A-disaccharide synthase
MEKLQGMGLSELKDLPWKALIPFFLQIVSLGTSKTVLPFLKVFPFPKSALFVDYGGFHLILGRLFRRAGIPIAYLAPPKLWAWGKFRLPHLQALQPILGVLFPFEKDFYLNLGWKEVFFVGHPVAELLEVEKDPSPHRFYLLPGSRPQEWKAHLPFLLQFLPFIRSTGLIPTFGIPHHLSDSDLLLPSIEAEIKIINSPEDYGDGVMAIAASGTVNLELAALGIPHLVFYKPHPLTLWMGRRLVNLRWLNPVNLLAGREILPEFIGEEATISKMIPYLERIIRHSEAIKDELRSAIFVLKNSQGFNAFRERFLAVIQS